MISQSYRCWARIFSGAVKVRGHMSAVEAVRILYQELRLKHGRKRTFELHIIGNVHPGFDEFAKNLTQLAKGLPIKFHLSVSRDELRENTGQVTFHLAFDRNRCGKRPSEQRALLGYRLLKPCRFGGYSHLFQ